MILVSFGLMKEVEDRNVKVIFFEYQRRYQRRHIYEQKSLKKFLHFEADSKDGGLVFKRKRYVKSKLVGFTISKSFSILRTFYFHVLGIIKLNIPKCSLRPGFPIECLTNPSRNVRVPALIFSSDSCSYRKCSMAEMMEISSLFCSLFCYFSSL